jgi:hypothetical protein
VDPFAVAEEKGNPPPVALICLKLQFDLAQGSTRGTA